MKVYTIQINYKSGISMTAEFTEFSVKGGTYSWKSYNLDNRPYLLGADSIESIWRVGIREVGDVTE